MNDYTQFEIPGVITIGEGEGGLQKLEVKIAEAEATIYLHGATVTRYDVAGQAILFCSRTSRYDRAKAIRGGVPLIFPWFGPHPNDATLPQHGFARTALWELIATEATERCATVILSLSASAETLALWPHDFVLTYTIHVGNDLEMTLDVVNRSDTPFTFDEALHTYLTVSDVQHICITGLENTEYYDKVDGFARKRQADSPVRLAGETDRLFIDTDANCRILDAARIDIEVAKSGSHSTVVWNPWEEKAEALADLSGGQWSGFVCVETVNAADNAIALEPGASHSMTAIIAPIAD